MLSLKTYCKGLIASLLFLFIAESSIAQIWSEDFSTYSHQTGVRGGGVNNVGDYPGGVTKWTLDVSDCNFSNTGDYFYVSNGQFEGQDLDGWAIWTSESINISGYSNVGISIYMGKDGANMESNDEIIAYYSVDGGAYVQFGYLNDDPWPQYQTFTASGLSGSTLRIRVRMTNNGGSEEWMFDDISVIEESPYCSSIANTSYNTSITLVDLNTISNASGKPSGYSDYTNLSTDLSRGSSYNLTVNINTDGPYSIYTYVWIDWNQDDDFDDAGEQFDLGSNYNTSDGATSNSPYLITVPGTATLGSTRMRVSTKYYSYPSSCENNHDGEVEDYSINITGVTLPIISGFTPTSTCEGSDATVVISGSGYIDVSDVSFNGTSVSYTVNSSTQITATVPGSVTTGTISITTTGGIVTSSSSFSVYTVPIITGTTPASRTGPGTVTLGATSSGGTINWYSSATGGSSLGSGTTFTTPSLSSTTTYYVDATSNGCTTSSRTAVVATIISDPNCPIVLDQNTIYGNIFVDNNGDGIYDGSESNYTGTAITLNLYEDTNGNGLLDDGAPVLQTTSSDGTGKYSFDITSSSQTVRDEFNSQSYSLNDGTQNWSGSWTENDPLGRISVSSGRLQMNNLDSYWVMRSADLSGTTSATLTFDWETSNLFGQDLLVRISSDGSNFTTIGTFNGSSSGTFTADITSYISSTTTVLFTGNNNWDTNDYAWIDNIEIEYTATASDGDYIVEIDQGTISSAYTLSSSALLSSSFVGISGVSCNNDFGIEPVIPAPIANNDAINCANPTIPTVIDVLSNDTDPDGVPIASTVQIVGTSNPGDSYFVSGEGTWSVNTSTGAITFTPLVSFSSDPTPIQYTVDDIDGNTSNQATVTLTYDRTAPTADALPDLGPYECFNEIPSENIADVTGETDNCGGVVTVAFVSDSPNPGCSGTVTRTYSITDERGNSANITQTITISGDVTDPEAKSLPNLGPYDCYSDIPAYDLNDVEATDNCGAPPTVTFVGDSPDPGCSGTVTRTYSVADLCGNSIQVTQTIYIEDLTPPTSDSLPDIGPFDCYISIPAPNINDVTGEYDACGGPITVTYIGDTGDMGCGGEVIRTYRLSDQCGNEVDITQTITTLDTIGPTADPLPTLGTYSCFAEIPPPNINDVTGESDNCGATVTVSHISDSGFSGCSGTIVRTYRLSDQCGNYTDIYQDIIVDDTTPPTADPLPDLGPYNCYANIPNPSVALVTGESDNCGGIVFVSYVGDTGDPGCSGTVTRTYRITDQCGNFTDLLQNITINDNTGPVLSGVPSNTTVSCTAVPAAASPTAIDNCGSTPTITFSETSTQTSDGSCTDFSYTITRTWTATDACGNSTPAVQIITVQDNIAPTIVAPPNVTVDCSDDSTPAGTGNPTVTDNCDPSPDITYSDAITQNGCAYQTTITRTWTATDACGNSASDTQIIGTQDNIPPTIICPVDTTVETPDDIPVVNFADITVSDNCSETDSISIILLNEVYTGLDAGAGFCPETVIRTYRATDECGNYADCTYTITVNDLSDCGLCQSQVPFYFVDLSSDPGTTLSFEDIERIGLCCEAHSPYRCVSFNILLHEDAVGIEVLIDGALPDPKDYSINCTEITPIDNIICIPGGKFYTFTYCKQGSNLNDFTFTSIEGSVIGDEITTRVECGKELTVLGVTESTTTWRDITGNGLYDSYLSCTTGCNTTIFTPDASAPAIIQYEVCGETVNSVCQGGADCDTVTVRVYPEINLILDGDTEFCIDNPQILTANVLPSSTYLLYWYDGPNGTGNIVSTTSTYTPSSSGSYSIIAVDTISGLECNEDTLNFTVTIQDLPVFDLGSNSSVCIGDSTFFDLPDNYTYEWSPSANVTYGADSSQFYVTHSATQTYTVTAYSSFGCTSTDTWTANATNCISSCPTVTICPDATHSITTLAEFNAIGGTTNFPCSVSNSNISLISTSSDGNSCPETITKTYQIWDDCGNTTTCDVIVIRTDVEDPVVTCPSDIPYEACSVSDVGSLSGLALSTTETSIILTQLQNAGGDASDNCGIQSITYRDNPIGTCPTVLERIFTVTDLCGNQDVCVQTITISDSTDPLLVCPPTQNFNACSIDDILTYTTLPYTNIVNTISYATYTSVGGSVSDGCALSSIVYYDSRSGTCPITVTRHFIATDSCGNTANCEQIIIIDDTEPPVIVDVPPDVDFPCSDCIQSFLNSSFEEPVQTSTSSTDPYFIDWGGYGNWIYWHEDGVSGWQTTASDNRIELHPSGFDNMISADGDQHAELNAHQNSDLYQEFCTVPTTHLHIGFAHGKRSKANNTTPDIMEVLIGDATLPESTYTTYGPFTQTEMSTWTYHTIDYAIPVGQTLTTFIFRAVQGSPVSILEGNLIDDISVLTLFDATYIPSASDNCYYELVLDEERIDGDCEDNYQLIRSWTATDDCGNVTIETQTVTVGDFTGPELFGVPNDTTVNCEVPAPPTVTAVDDCDPNVSVVLTADTIGSGCSYTIERTWSSTDDCNNTTELTQTITIEDVISPVITCPGNLNYQCITDVPAAFVDLSSFITAGGSATDNCELDESSFRYTENVGGSCPQVITRTYYIEDICSNIDSCTQTITINDTTNPTASNPVTVTISCIGDLPVPDINAVTDEADNCGVPDVAFVSDVLVGDSCTGSITRTYSVTDDCNNSISVTQTYDMVHQDFTAPTPTTAAVDCYADIVLPTPPTVTDDCGTTLTPTGPVEGTVPACEGDVTYTWTYTDCAGFTHDYVHTVTITRVDFTAPSPTTAAVDCYADIVLPTPPTVTDDCGTTLTPTGPVEGTVPACEGDVTYTWTYTDCAGFTHDYVHTVTITRVDFTAPTPTTAAVDCYADIVLPTPPTVTDDCGTTLTPTGPVEGTVPACEGDVTYTWTYTDCAGFTHDYVHTVTITRVDFTAPTPTTAAVDCYADIVLPTPPTVTDDCGTTLTPTGPVEGTVPACEGDVTYTWTYTDCAGFTHDYVHTVTITRVDFTAPSPTTAAVDCYADIVLPTPPTVTDDCGTTLTPTGPVEGTVPACEGDVTYTWTYTDCAGFTHDYVHTVTITRVDFTAPSPTTAAVDCYADIVLPTPPTVTDDCGTTLTPTGPVEGTVPACEGDVTYTWTYTDCAGFTHDYVHTVTITRVDFTAPSPTTAAVDCYADIVLPTPPTVTDDCGTTLTPTGPVEGTVPACEGDVTYTWTYTDCAGFTHDYVHTVTITRVDFTAPTPTTAAVDCYADIVLPTPPTVTDDCGTTLTPTGPVEGTVPACEGDVTYTWTYTDCAGFTHDYVHTVTITRVDFTAPSPTTAAVDCYADIVLPTPPTVTDDCGTTLTPTGPVEGTVPACEGDVTYTWTYTDCAGFTHDYVHTVTITRVDFTAPSPTTAAVDCYADIVLPTPPTVTDDCGTTLTPTGPVEGTVPACEGDVTYTWTYTDCAGFTHDYVHTVTITRVDFTAPSPTTAAVDCYADIVLPTPPTVTDDCGTTLTPTGPVEGTVPACEGDVTYTWTYTDCAGFTHDYVHTVTITRVDFTAPSPTTAAVDCYADIVLPTPPTVTDDCGTTLTPTGPVEGTVPACEGDVTYTWTYTDCAGFTHDYVHTVTITRVDFTAPSPTTAAVDCYADIVLPTPPTVTDDCGTTLTPTGPVEGTVPACEGDVTYTWTYTDCAGFTHDYVHTVTITRVDFTAPSPTTAAVDCYADIVLPTPPTVTDDCGTTLTPTGPVEGTVPACEGDVTYTWTYTDCAGFTHDYVHTVTITRVDFTAPTPTTAAVDCYADIVLPTPPTVTDDCGTTLTPTGPVEGTVPACEGDVTYTWTYTDCAGFTHDYVHTVTITRVDFTAPTPTTAAVDCYADIVLPTPPTVTDDCGTTLTPTGPVEGTVPACEGDVTYTWTYTDCAGFTHDYVHTVTITRVDFTAPSPTTAAVDCYADIVLPTPPTVTDDCGTTLTPTGPVEGTVPACEGDVTYTWTYTDCAGFTHDYVHTVTITRVDFTAPSPTTAAVDCYADIVLPTPPTVTDDCGTTLTPTGPVEGTVPACEGDVTYTWTYTDCAGFTHDYVHTVTITRVDFTAPSPTTAAVDCYADIVLPTPPTVTDDCGTTLTPTGPWKELYPPVKGM